MCPDLTQDPCMASCPKQKHLPCPYPTSILPCPYPTSVQDPETDPTQELRNRRLEAVASLKKDSYQRWDPAPLTKFWKMWKPSNHKRCILAEGAIALSVTLSGGALFASWKLLQFPSSLIVKIILAIFMRASAQQILQPSCALQSILTDLHLLH